MRAPSIKMFGKKEMFCLATGAVLLIGTVSGVTVGVTNRQLGAKSGKNPAAKGEKAPMSKVGKGSGLRSKASKGSAKASKGSAPRDFDDCALSNNVISLSNLTADLLPGGCGPVRLLSGRRLGGCDPDPLRSLAIWHSDNATSAFKEAVNLVIGKFSFEMQNTTTVDF